MPDTGNSALPELSIFHKIGSLPDVPSGTFKEVLTEARARAALAFERDGSFKFVPWVPHWPPPVLALPTALPRGSARFCLRVQHSRHSHRFP